MRHETKSSLLNSILNVFVRNGKMGIKAMRVRMEFRYVVLKGKEIRFKYKST